MPEPTGELVTPVGMSADGFPRAFSQLFGFSEVLNLNGNTIATAASYTYTSPTVPSGELWVVTVGSVNSQSAAIGGVWMYCVLGGGFTLNIEHCAALVQYKPCLFTGQVFLTEGQGMGFFLSGINIGDDIRGGFVGYKMEL